MTDNTETTPQPPQIVNPLLERARIPGETFRLPSGGIFYENGELNSDVKDGEVHIYPMTTIDEIVMKSPDMLYSGKAIEEVFARCIPQIKKPMDMLARDVDFLMICLRKVTFGAEMQIMHTHTCDGAKEHSYIISMDTFIKESKRIDPTKVAATYTVTLVNGQRVRLEPIRYKHFIELMQLNESEEATPDRIRQVMFDTLLHIIVSVDEIEDRELIREWLNVLPAGWLRTINKKIEESTDWGPSFETTVTCRDCGEEVQLAAPLNPIAFFT